jgi:Response regulator receiver domain
MEWLASVPTRPGIASIAFGALGRSEQPGLWRRFEKSLANPGTADENLFKRSNCPGGRGRLVCTGDIAAQFRQEGWQVLEAETGAEALELLQEGQSIDILVTDITLADSITGWDVAEALRHLHPQVPVIYASGGRDIDSAGSYTVCLCGSPSAVMTFSQPGASFSIGRSRRSNNRCAVGRSGRSDLPAS